MNCKNRNMRKTKFIIVLIIGILFFNMPVLYATDTVSFVGDDEVETGVSQTITIHVTYSEEIGVLEGVLSYDTENIEDFSVSSSYNGWTTTYNESTRKFNTLYASGTTDDDVLEIIYTLKEGSTSGYITLSDISLTTISYSIIDVDDITKTITAKTSTSTDEDTTNTNVSTSSSSSSTDSTSTSTTTSNSSTTSNSNTSTTSTSSLPYTGNTRYIIAGIILISILGFLVYKKVRYYKEI